MEESKAMKTLVSYAIIGRVFREGFTEPLSEDAPKPSKEQIRAEAKKNLKKTLHQLRGRR